MATRREFLAGAAGLCLAARAGRASAPAPRLASAVHARSSDEGAIWQDGRLASFAIPARGHGLAHGRDGHVVLMGRRPGLFSSIVDPDNPAVGARVFRPSANCRFSGHAAITVDRTALVSGEFDSGSYAAFAVARDPVTGAERARWKLDGIEPHDLAFACGDTRLIVALGGLVNDGGVAGPAYNPDGVRSEVVEVDPSSGAVVARHRLPPAYESLSLRHLSAAPRGDCIAVAAQDQDLSERRPLVGLLAPGAGIELLPMPDPRDFDLRGYVGSLAFDASGAFVAAASPRGSLVGLWSAPRRAWLGAIALADVCGIAAGSEPATFWASTGHGGIFELAAGPRGLDVVRQWRADAGFDNHLLLI